MRIRRKNAWVVTVGLLLTLVLVTASASGEIALPLQWAVLVGLGINVIAALWEHREKMHALLGTERR